MTERSIQKFIGRRPIGAFGNSDDDLQMLQWTCAGPGACFRVYVHHTDAERGCSYLKFSDDIRSALSALPTAPKYNSGPLFNSVKYLPSCAMAIECCASGVKAGAKLFRKRVIGSWRIRVVSKSEAIGMTLNNRIYFVIVTILEFVGLLILLNYVAALPL